MAGYKKLVSRKIYLVVSLLLVAAVILPIFNNAKAGATGTITSRSIELSTSVTSASANYLVSFNVATTSTLQGIVVDFCNDPIPGDSCTAPTSPFTVGATPTVTGASSNISTLSTYASANSGRTLEITGTSTGSITTGTTISFTLTSAVNPGGTPGTFYARIFTYSSSATATAYTATAPGAYVDAGGIALSTAAQITIQAKVEEQINFCIYLSSGSCGSGGTSILLGDTNDILSTAGPFVDKTGQYSIQTNAAHGATIRMEGTTLTSGSNTIPQIGTSPTTPTTGTSQFGLCTYQNSGGGGTITPTSPYNDANCSGTTQSSGTASPGGAGTAKFALDTNNTTGTTSPYGMSIATATYGATTTGTLVFLANISNAQAPGVYTTTLTFVATGVY